MQKDILAGRTRRSASKQPLRGIVPTAENDVHVEPPVNRPFPIIQRPPTPSGSIIHPLPKPTPPPTGLPSFESSNSLPPAYSSNSDSDTDIEILVASLNQSKMSNTQKNAGVATSNHPVINHPPVFSEGQITAKELMIFEQDCEAYFLNTKGGDPKEQRVARIITAFKDPLVRDWITSNRATLVKLTFDEFMTQLRDMFLPKDWEENVRTQILGNKMPRNERFILWAQGLQAMNCVLRNTRSHLSEQRLRDTLEANIDGDLRLLAREAGASAKEKLSEWMDLMERLDAKRKMELKRQREVAADEVQRNSSAKRQNSRNSGAFTMSSTRSASGTSDQKRVPRLTQEERDILSKNQGCFKCHRMCQGHRAGDCPNGFPSPENYRPVTMDDVARAKKEKKPADNHSHQYKTGSTSKTVASIQEAPANVSSSAEEMDENAVFAVFGPTASSLVLGNGSFSEGDISVSLPPLRSKHFVWKCNVDGPNSDFPIAVSSLIDNGAHVVLIRPEIVQKLNLPIQKLNRPECIDVAIDSSNKEKKPQELSSYVLLSVSSLDHAFHAKPVRALITPGLCMPIILGLPWLEKNKIICDHADRSCYVKTTGYNLLHPPKITPPPPPRKKLRVQLKENRELKKRALEELVAVVKQKWLPRRAKDETVKALDIVAMIQNHIATISLLQDMDNREQKLKVEFSPVFEPIPHIDELPTTVLARIKLKEAERTIRSHTYPSPRKYAEAWSTLIQEHLHAGRIQPSASSYTSPAFLIPKSDPSALPRWVNDYRQLNANTVTDCHPLPRIDDILNDCAKGKIWATIDMTNSFFQTRMHPDDIPLTAVNTPLGLYEWLVMPMGLKNSPSIHQRQVTSAL